MEAHNKQKALIIGYGRFGRLLADVFRDDLEIFIAESSQEAQKGIFSDGFELRDLSDAGSFDLIFICVPISQFKQLCERLEPYVGPAQTIVDACSVKVYPAAVMKNIFKNSKLIASHPLFGPNSAKGGVTGQKVALCEINTPVDDLQKLWLSKGVDVILTSPETHDKDTAYSQGATYTVGYFVNNMHAGHIVFDTKNYKSLMDVANLTSKDSNQLFRDMLYYNPYFRDVFMQMSQSWDDTSEAVHEILDERQPDEIRGMSI